LSEPVVQARSLRREFGSLVAVDSIDLIVPRGQFLGFLGPNGAGKSTTIKMLTGLLQPTSGSVNILGFDMATNAIEIKRRIGVVPEGLALFERLTGSQFLNFVGRMYGLNKNTAADRAVELLEFMDLADAAASMVVDYSHGMRKKIALAAAIIHRPEILFLDEPFEGVDAIAARTLKDMLNKFIAHGGTIFLTSHVLEVVERLCSHIAIIQTGRIVVSGALDELRSGVAVSGAEGKTETLEEIFVRIIGGERPTEELSWL
jgi:ABC-2 type transport system ATP-binding protein